MAGRRGPEVLAACSTPFCGRYAKKGMPFCERCWGLLTDDERASCIVANRSPFWPHDRVSAWSKGSFHCDDMTWETTPSGWLYSGGLTPGKVLHEFESRTTLAATAQLCWIRRLSQSREGRVLLANRGIEPQEIPT